MEEQKNDIELLLSDAGDFVETSAALWKLKTVDTLTDSVSTLASGLGIIGIMGLFVLTMSIGFALWIGDWLGKSFYGFFIIGGLYGIVGLICYLYRDRWLKEPVTNILIRKMLK
ncbi:hypothetical protein ACX0G9_01100 [Flavitalea flava]